MASKSLIKRLGRACAYSVLVPILTKPALAQYDGPRTLFGTPGLVDMPSARMAADGEISMGVGFFKNTQHYNLNFQALPWLETSFRYSGLQHFDSNYPVYYDRSFAVKARLVEESAWVPSIAVGLNDLVGSGVYGGEYLVASKQFGNVDATIGMGWGRLASTDLFRNPLTYISKSFETRVLYPATVAGATAQNILFHGPYAGLFGGFVWKTPVDGLSLAAEYSSDEYTLERQRGTFAAKNQFNFGASYNVTKSLNVGLDWLYGESAGFHLAYQIDPAQDQPERIGADVPEPGIRSLAEQQSALDLMSGRRATRLSYVTARSGALTDALWSENRVITNVEIRGQQLVLTLAAGATPAACANVASIVEQYDSGIRDIVVAAGSQRSACTVQRSPFFRIEPAAFTGQNAVTMSPAVTIDARGPAPMNAAVVGKMLRDALQVQQIAVQGINVGASVVTVYYTNSTYRREQDALERMIRLLMAKAPPDIEEFRLIAMEGDVPIRQFVAHRGTLERSYDQTGDLDFRANVVSSGAPYPTPRINGGPSYPNVAWDIFPQFRQQLFDPNNPFGVQLLAGADATVNLFRGFSISGEAELDIYDNFLTNRTSDSLLPHVRTDFVEYFTHGKNGIGDLEADYRFRLSPTLYGIARAGYLESMFGGVGGELLWRPDGQRWALGVDAYEVKQRNFDRLLGFQNYHVFTGHVSLYYASPWYGLDFALSAGQYLAGDRGVTLQVTRRFSTGVEIGTFFTKTNVSAALFGEGSFDKGIIIRIPLGYVMPLNTQREMGIILRPVQRDGGQRLLGDATLYDVTQRTSDDEIAQQFASLQ